MMLNILNVEGTDDERNGKQGVTLALWHGMNGMISVHIYGTIILLLVSGYKVEDVDIQHRHNLLWQNPHDDEGT